MEALSRSEKLYHSRRFQAALEILEPKLRETPDSVELYCLTGKCRLKLGDAEGAAEVFGYALQLDVHSVAALQGMAQAFEAGGLLDPAIEAWRQALLREVSNEFARDNLARLLYHTKHLEDAANVLASGLQLRPEHPGWRTSLSGCLLAQGRLDELDELARKPRDFRRDNPSLHMNWVRAQLYLSSSDGNFLKKVAVEWASWHTPLSKDRPRLPSLEGPLRIGILNTCLHMHNTTQHLLGWLPHVDPERIEVYLYAGSQKTDAWTERAAKYASSLTSIAGLADVEACRLIQSHRLHVLIDMNEFANGGRLALIALRPAPILLHWYGNAITTGLSVLDGRFSDEFAEPAGTLDDSSVEPIIRLSGGYHSYTDPPNCAAPVFETDRDQQPVLGCIHHPAKYSLEFLEVLKEILQRAPQAKLVCRRDVFQDRLVRQRFYNRLRAVGLPMERVELLGDEGAISTLACFNDFDLVPDSFPFTGDATACDTLRMGVPMVSLQGEHLCSRRGASLLKQIGFEKWVAADTEAYVAIVCELLSDLNRIRSIRRKVAEAFQKSPLCDGAHLAEELTVSIEALVARQPL